MTSRMERTGGGETPEGGSLWKKVGKVSRMLRFRNRHSKGMLGNGVFRSCEVRQVRLEEEILMLVCFYEMN